MAVKKVGLSWINVSDIKKAEEFFVDTLGLKLNEKSDEYGWMELSGTNGGGTFGVGKAMQEEDVGTNAVVTFTVDNIEETVKDLKKKGVNVGEIMEIPGHVKLANFADNDGNLFQLAEMVTNK